MKSIDQLLSGDFDDIRSTTISSDSLNSIDVSCNNFLGTTSAYYSNPTSNIQTQIDTLNTTTSNLQTLANAGGSGGYFCIYGEISDLKTTVNGGYFTFGGSLVNPPFRLGIFTPACTLISVCLNTTTTPAGTSPVISIVKLFGGTNPGIGGTNFTTTINMPVGSLLKKSTMNISFALGDAVNVYVTTSSTNICGNSRCTLIFQTNGVVGLQGETGLKGDDGQQGIQGFSGQQGIQGTSGQQGIPGTTGQQGTQGPQGLKGDTGQQGDMPTITVGTVSKLTAGSIPTCSLVGGALNFGLVTGDRGASGDRGEAGAKGDTGETGSKGDTGEAGAAASADATGILGTILAGAGLLIGGIAYTTIMSALTALTNAVAVLVSKTFYQSAYPLLYTHFSSDLKIGTLGNEAIKLYSTGDIVSGQITSSSSIQGTEIEASVSLKAPKIVGNIEYQDTEPSTLNIGQNVTVSTTPDTINIGKTTDTVNINGTISNIKCTHFVGNIEYASETEQSTLNIGQNGTIASTINLGRSVDTVNIGAVFCGDISGGDISCADISSGNIIATTVKAKIIGDIEYPNAVSGGTINIGRNSTQPLGTNSSNVINIGALGQSIFIGGSAYSTYSSYFTDNYINQFA